MKKPFFFLLILFFAASCKSTLQAIFSTIDNKTPHEKYAEKLDDIGLGKTPEGHAWKAASEKALQGPQTISLPYGQQGYFPLDKPRALGLAFKAKQGERITFTLTRKAANNFVLYADVFKLNGTTTLPLLAADTTETHFSFDATESGTYILRLQPELFRTGEYNLSIAIGASLGFPVAYSRANIGSFWGDNRDGGKRLHEGLDIFAPKLTPAVAAANGSIVSVREGGLGGKTVWLRPEGKDYTLYYAHLDKQLVQEGQSVKQGDTVGLVGNTGNAKYTPSHLHFGVYGSNGAVDPLPFVNRNNKPAPTVPGKNLFTYLQLINAYKNNDGELIKANTLLIPLAATTNAYIAEMPDGKLIHVPFAFVKSISTKQMNGIAVIKDSGAKNSGHFLANL